MSGSWRQKLNTGSSTEVELVRIDNALKYIMWGLYFIQAQGFKVKNNILMQDNKSTILMATTGQFSCSKRTKHIKNRYFMIKDKIGKGEVIIQYCPTGDMWAAINTKALQDSLFYKMRACLHIQTCYRRKHRSAGFLMKIRSCCIKLGQFAH